jgi:hypothetical protein
MGYAALPGRVRLTRLTAVTAAALLIMLTLAWASRPAAAASLAGRDGMIHACFKAKGKAKGTLRVVRSAKAKCPRGWKKTAWNARGPAATGGSGEEGSAGGNGEGGAPGTTGANGATGTKGTVTSLEKQVTELLTKVKSLESVLAGVTNSNLKDAIGAVPVVAALCGQAGQLNSQTASLGSAMGALDTVLAVAFPLLDLPTVPAALPAFSCP